MGDGDQDGGGFHIGSIGSVGGDVVGRDKIGGDNIGRDYIGRDRIEGAVSPEAIEAALHPLTDAVQAAPAATRGPAEATVAELKKEAVKGKDADDGVMSGLIKGLVALVPGAASAVVSAFGTPILAGLVGPATKIALDALLGK